jgi:hypothetical protein
VFDFRKPLIAQPGDIGKRPKGKVVVPEQQIAPIMKALALGIAPDVFGRTPLDAIQTVGCKTLKQIAKTLKLGKVSKNGLVFEEDGWLKWRPDPEFDNSGYRAYRFVRVRRLNSKQKFTPTSYWAEVEWDSGHDETSSFFTMLLRFGVAYEAED